MHNAYSLDNSNKVNQDKEGQKQSEDNSRRSESKLKEKNLK